MDKIEIAPQVNSPSYTRMGYVRIEAERAIRLPCNVRKRNSALVRGAGNELYNMKQPSLRRDNGRKRKIPLLYKKEEAVFASSFLFIATMSRL